MSYGGDYFSIRAGFAVFAGILISVFAGFLLGRRRRLPGRKPEKSTVEYPASTARSATEKQRHYAESLGVYFDPGISCENMSDLIQGTLFNRDPASASLRRFAAELGLQNRLLPRTELLQCIWGHLCCHGTDTQLASWFASRLYRDMTDGKWEHPDESDIFDLLPEVALRMIEDKTVIRSLRRLQVGHLIDHWSDELGQTESKHTAAYKAARKLLLEMQERMKQKRGAQ